MADAERYLSLLHDSPEEQQALFETVIVNETWFFRDRAAGEPEAADRVRAHRRRLDADQEGSL
jgi:chemotaxis methyl-accepting protein methylase